jgi:hypothetical protein
MRARIWTAALLAFATPAVVAQDMEEPASASVADAYAKVKTEYKAAYDEFVTAYRAAESEDERNTIYAEQYPKAIEWFPELWAAIDAAPQDPDCVEPLLWIAGNDRTGEHTARAGQSLLANHLDSDGLGEACWTFARAEGGGAFLERVMQKSPHADVRAVAQYNFAKSLLESDSEKNSARADELFSDIELNHADVEHPYRGTLGAAAEADLFELRNLQIGMQVPEIEGEDLDGVAFKLSDYRGKAVLLDFWGNW